VVTSTHAIAVCLLHHSLMFIKLFTLIKPPTCQQFRKSLGVAILRPAPPSRQFITSAVLGKNTSAKFGRKIRDQFLAKSLPRIMADPANADVLAPLQAAVKVQVRAGESNQIVWLVRN